MRIFLLTFLYSIDEKYHAQLEDQNDISKVVEIYGLKRSQLVFSIAVFQNNNQLPVIYNISSVFSNTMTAITSPANDDGLLFRCVPQRGDCKGGEEIIMVIPKIDKRTGNL